MSSAVTPRIGYYDESTRDLFGYCSSFLSDRQPLLPEVMPPSSKQGTPTRLEDAAADVCEVALRGSAVTGVPVRTSSQLRDLPLRPGEAAALGAL